MLAFISGRVVEAATCRGISLLRSHLVFRIYCEMANLLQVLRTAFVFVDRSPASFGTEYRFAET